MRSRSRAKLVALILTVAVPHTATASDARGAKEATEVKPAEAPTGHGEIVERVVAVVNGEALFLSELRRRAVPFLPQVMQSTSSELERYKAMSELYRELLTLLIDEQLIQQTARELDISVSKEDVDRAVDNVKQQSGLEEDGFWEAVSAQGFTPERYRADVRRQLVRLKVMNQKVRSRVNVTEEDVRRRYDEMARRARRTSRFHVTHIFVPVAEATTTEVAAARRRAIEIRNTLDDKNFDAQAAKFGGGDLGWVTQGDLPDELENALLDLEVGQISAPVRGPAGYHVFLLKDRSEGSDALGDYDTVRADLYREMLETAMAKQEAQFLKELRASGLVTRRL